MTPHGKGHSSVCPLLTKEDIRKTMNLKGRMRPKDAGLGMSTVALSLEVRISCKEPDLHASLACMQALFDVACLDMSGACIYLNKRSP